MPIRWVVFLHVSGRTSEGERLTHPLTLTKRSRAADENSARKHALQATMDQFLAAGWTNVSVDIARVCKID
jgi:hypothetical protein